MRPWIRPVALVALLLARVCVGGDELPRWVKVVGCEPIGAGLDSGYSAEIHQVRPYPQRIFKANVTSESGWTADPPVISGDRCILTVTRRGQRCDLVFKPEKPRKDGTAFELRLLSGQEDRLYLQEKGRRILPLQKATERPRKSYLPENCHLDPAFLREVCPASPASR